METAQCHERTVSYQLIVKRMIATKSLVKKKHFFYKQEPVKTV